MVHLAGLPGSVHFDEPFAKTLERALTEARILEDAGFDALLLQNTGDVPASEEGDEATVAFMTLAAHTIKQTCQIPLGINVLMNGSKASLAIAKAVQAAFVRIKINIGAVTTSTGIVEANPHEILSFRNRIEGKDLLILGDTYDRTSAPLGELPLEVFADLAIRHADVDALVISGYDVADTQARLKLLRKKLPDAFLITGGGANTKNLPDLMQLSDAVIVGSSIKTGGGFLDPVDPQKASAFTKTAQEIRSKLLK